MHFIILGHTSNLISCVSIITYFRMITLQGTIFWTMSSNKELAHRRLPYLATTSLGETHAPRCLTRLLLYKSPGRPTTRPR